MTRRPRNYALVAIAASSLSLAGCGTTGTGSNISDIIAQAQQIARTACGFLPAVDTVSAILNNGVLTTADSIAHAICAAVAPPAATGALRSKRQGPPMVGNVEVRGEFVR